MDQYIRRGPLAKRLSVHPITLDRWIAAGRFPKPVRLGANTVVWREFDVEAWVEKHTQKEDAAAQEA